MTTRTPKWAVGMRKIGPGAYVDQRGALHVFAEEICAALGVPATEENCRCAEETTLQVLREQGATVERHDVEATDV